MKTNKRQKNKLNVVGPTCYHDNINAIKLGSKDYVCPKCKELLDPTEWFFYTYFNSLGVKFVDCGMPETQKRNKK